MCYVFCVDNCRHDLSHAHAKVPAEHGDAQENKLFSVSALRGVVSAVCDNLCKPQWSHDLTTCLAALDCLNCLATLPHVVCQQPPATSNRRA